ncbi:DUF2188 domain-containing protein [Aeromicrobium ginsengisoli]|uniref:DUF2188 domain-containing protein n=1 Tax=Aeromicrobium ginsengisoli TaxID=363867 RepID=A0A5M4FER8_9ACTN|nr:DUF2188 domain-containing protein [Aeromicrobium ginsengisoli]KAA1397847.1 DUF2188 domain-containing protein [Aeromicrobium ginsengisoli]
MTQGDVETYFDGSSWHSRFEGKTDPFHTSPTKEREVIAGHYEAKRLAVEHIIKDKDGRIVERNNYAPAPRNGPLDGS